MVGYTHAGGVDRPLVVWKGMGANTSVVVVPHMNWRGLFGRGSNSSGGATTVAIQWTGFQTTAYHSFAPSQESTTNWMGSLIEGQRDPGGGMYMRNRYYDPAAGQFTQTDPIGIAGGLNTYGFANGDPVSYSDPYGLFTCPDPRRPDICPEPGTQPSGTELGAPGWLEAASRKYVSTSASVTLGNRSISFGGTDAESGVSESHVLNVPSVGASVDIGVNRSAPAGASTWSIDVGAGKHGGVSINFFNTPEGGTGLQGFTFHVGNSTPTFAVGVSVPAAPSGKAPAGSTATVRERLTDCGPLGRCPVYE